MSVVTSVRRLATGHAPQQLRSLPVEVLAEGAERICRRLLGKAGIEVGGGARHDIEVHDRRFFARVLRDGVLGLGESYMEGWWDSPALDSCLERMLRAGLDDSVRLSLPTVVQRLRSRVLNLQSPNRAYEIGLRHYDAGNDLFRAMLDRHMVYTCAYWQGAETLDQAQEAKLELVCRKLGLEPGMRVLDLGCGFGGFARFAAERHGAEVTGYTVSKEQVALGRELCRGLPVELVLGDYREASGQYDAVVSIGIMEHVGVKNYRTYMELAARCLKPGGVALVHTIAASESRGFLNPWFDRYIFPNAVLPSLTLLAQAAEGLLVVEDVHNIGPHYDRTLLEWHKNFERAWPELRPRYGEAFGRMWRFYLLASAAGFRSRSKQLYQLVLTHPGRAQPACRCV